MWNSFWLQHLQWGHWLCCEIRKYVHNNYEEVIEYVSSNTENWIEKDNEDKSNDGYDYYEGFDEEGGIIQEE